jgi:hypothetical protein
MYSVATLLTARCLCEYLNGGNHLEELSIDGRVKPNCKSDRMVDETGMEE